MRRRPARDLAYVACLAGALWAGAAHAQSFVPFGFGPPVPAQAEPTRDPDARRDGTYGRISTGFAVASSRRFGTVAGPTVGAEIGRWWRQGDLVVGVSGGFDYLGAFGRSGIPSFNGYALTRDFGGGFNVKAGTLVRDDVLVYARAGVAAAHQTLRFGGAANRLAWTRDDIVVIPNAGVGVEWAVTDRLTVGLEVNAAQVR